MIKLKISDIINSVSTLKELMGKSLKSRVAYKVARLAREVENEYKLYDEKRIDLIKKYANHDENGELILDEEGSFSVADENVAAFRKELMELMDVEIELNVDKLSLEELDGCDFTPSEMVNLMVFVEE